ncbi:MAG: PcfJ domain-containing protein [Selenomonadaceae bacterium]|nr:PcfJ domain-containing protein [Selenomonadaceae bacterium]
MGTVLMTHAVPQLYSAYSVIIGESNDGTVGSETQSFVQQIKYYCHNCRTSFTVWHQYRGGYYYGGHGFGNFIVYCPHCGHRHENLEGRHNIYAFTRAEYYTPECAPLAMEIILTENERGFTLKLKAPTLVIRQENEFSQRLINQFGTRFEKFSFDVKSRRATYSISSSNDRATIKQYELGNPFDVSLDQDSLLRQLRADNLSELSRDGTIALLRTLRDGIRKKWRKVHGYDIGSLFVGHGKANGRLLFPLMNLAFRLQFPDAPNLPLYLRDGNTAVGVAKKRCLMTDDAMAAYASAAKDRKSQNSVLAVIKAFRLPDEPQVRRLITNNFFVAPELSTIYEIAGYNSGYAMTIYQLMQDLILPQNYAYCTEYRYPNELYDLLLELKDHYPVASLIALLRRNDWHQVIDIKRMLDRLVAERKPDAWRVKLKNLHDWLVTALKEQEEKGYRLAVPEHIQRRLAMQLDSIKFFLPEHTDVLASASDELHNCVRTYRSRVASGSCYIVLMADDKGKLVACLEVAGGQLVQAKLKHNRYVSSDPVINKAVIDWCAKAKIKIATKDVSAPEKPLELERIA